MSNLFNSDSCFHFTLRYRPTYRLCNIRSVHPCMLHTYVYTVCMYIHVCMYVCM